MKAFYHSYSFCLLFILPLATAAQDEFRTIVPQAPVFASESFSIQYVIADMPGDEFSSPKFKDKELTLVSGPAIHYSISPSPGGFRTKNFVFTVVAPQPGLYSIPRALIIRNGRKIWSKETQLKVSSKQTGLTPAPNSDYYLRPGEDPARKTRANLFVRVQVNRRQCFVGQPLQATFKLYSRLQSKSDIVKNPGFYGFTVVDQVTINNNQSRVESVNGKLFVVYTIREVQLYPLRAGSYSIDPMEIDNRIEYSLQPTNKTTQQEIREGVYNEDSLISSPSGTISYDYHVRTDRIQVEVIPFPQRDRPEQFNGATGRFTISAADISDSLQLNSQGSVELTIRGQGNFTQLAAPVVDWPQGLEHYDASISDSLDNKRIPQAGRRVYRFPFVAVAPGRYTIPPIRLCFFDPDSNKYKTILTQPIKLSVVNSPEQSAKPEGAAVSTAPSQLSRLLWWSAALLVLFVPGLFYYFRKKGRQNDPEQEHGSVVTPQPRPTAELDQVRQAINQEGLQFYELLQRAIWEVLAEIGQLKGSRMNKAELRRLLNQSTGETAKAGELAVILQECETVLFTGVETTNDRKEMLDRAVLALEEIIRKKR